MAYSRGDLDRDRGRVPKPPLLLPRVRDDPREQQFGTTGTGEAAVQIYVEPIDINADNHSLQGNISLVAGSALRERLATAPDQDIFLILSHGKTAQEIKFRLICRSPLCRSRSNSTAVMSRIIPSIAITATFPCNALQMRRRSRARPNHCLPKSGFGKRSWAFNWRRGRNPPATRPRSDWASTFAAAAASRSLRSPPMPQWSCAAARH
jgi:hypothetical protein